MHGEGEGGTGKLKVTQNVTENRENTEMRGKRNLATASIRLVKAGENGTLRITQSVHVGLFVVWSSQGGGEVIEKVASIWG